MLKFRTGKSLSLLSVLLLSLMLAACSGNDSSGSPSPSGSPSATPTATASDPPQSPSDEPSATPEPTPSASASEPSGTPTDLPPTKLFPIELEGMKEEREAALAEGDGFYFYKFEQFSFDKASGKLSMDFDPRYEVVIEKLPSDYSGDMLTVEGKEELAANGEVTDVLADNPNRALEGATIHLTSVSDQFRKEYIVKEFGGNGYIMHVTSVVGGEGEGFYTLAYTSINSIVNAE